MTLFEKAKEIAKNKDINFEYECRGGKHCPGFWIEGAPKAEGFVCEKHIAGLGCPCEQCWNSPYSEETQKPDLTGLITITAIDDTQAVYMLDRGTKWEELSEEAKRTLHKSDCYLQYKYSRAYDELSKRLFKIANSLSEEEISALPDGLKDFITDYVEDDEEDEEYYDC